MTVTKKGGLGKGLAALLQNAETDITTTRDSKPVGTVSEIEISQIEANPFQPRTDFDKQALQELSASIKVHGLIQPITVRKMGYDKYQIISGERRTRAAIEAGLKTLPAYIRLANDQEMLEMALIENIQRQDLNAIEVALSYKRLIDECTMTQEQVAERVGKERSTITNYLRLLKLPVDIQAAIRDGLLSMGHARAIIGIENEAEQLRIFNEIREGNLSVRMAEELARLQKEPDKETKPVSSVANKKGKHSDGLLLNDYTVYQRVLSDRFNAKVTFKANEKGKGNIQIQFEDLDELQRLIDMLEESK
jgi:ParB family chromosome partitioning protein